MTELPMLGESPRKNPVKATDYLIAGAGGAALGFLDNQQKENEAAKVKLEQERQVKLLMLKEEMAGRREERKQEAQQEFELGKMGLEQDFKAGESSKDRAAKLIEAGDKTEFERWKVGEEGKNRLSVANINAEARQKSGTGGRNNGLTEMQQYRLETDLSKLEDNGISEGNVNQANRIRQRLGLPTYQKVLVSPGKPGGFFVGKKAPVYDYELSESTSESDGAGGGEISGGMERLFSDYGAVKASRAKKGANDGKQPMPAATGAPGDVLEPQPISGDSMPSLSNEFGPSSGFGEGGASSSATGASQQASETTKAVEQVVVSKPMRADIGQILGLFAKGLVNVGEMSIDGLQALKWTLENTGDISRSMTEPYKQLSAEVGQALVDAGAFMVEGTPYEQKVEALNRSKTRKVE